MSLSNGADNVSFSIAADVQIKMDTQGICWEEVNTLLRASGLTDHTVDETRFAFEHSQLVVFACSQGSIVGCGRALTDFISQAAIYNIAVTAAFHNRGLGRLIVERLAGSVKRCNIILYTHPDTVGWYQKMGFKRMKTGMVRYQGEEAPEEMRAMGFI